MESDAIACVSFLGGAKVDWTGLRHTNCATLCLYSEEVGPGRQECKVTLCHSLGLFYTVRFHCSSFYHLEFSLSLSFLERCWLDQEVRSSNNATITEVTGHTSPYLMKYIGRFQSIGGTVCLAMHENILKITFYWGSIGIQESVTEILNYRIRSTLGPFRKFHDVLISPNLSQICSAPE